MKRNHLVDVITLDIQSYRTLGLVSGAEVPQLLETPCKKRRNSVSSSSMVAMQLLIISHQEEKGGGRESLVPLELRGGGMSPVPIHTSLALLP